MHFTTDNMQEILFGKGFVSFPGALSLDVARECRDVVNRIQRLDEEASLVEENRTRIYGLVQREAIFAQVLAPWLLDAVKAILGTSMISLSGFSAHVVNPGLSSVGMHIDYPYFAMKEPFPVEPLLSLQAIWALDDFRDDNGAPYFVAGSQRLRRAPRENDAAERTTVTGKVGTLILSHPLTWHDSRPNRSSAPRAALLANFTPFFIRPIEAPTFGRCDLTSERDPMVRALLALDFYDNVGKQGARRMRDLDDLSTLYETAWKKA